MIPFYQKIYFLRAQNTPEEKSKKRASELKASVAATKKSNPLCEGKRVFILSEQEQEAIEASIVDELNRTLAIVHTSSTYILIEKDEWNSSWILKHPS